MVDETGFVALSTAAPDLPNSLRGILELEDGLERARHAAEGKSPGLHVDDVSLDPVIPEPQAIWALALNFQTHIDETGLTTSPDHPQVFMRQPASHVGHMQPLRCPPPDVAQAFEYEGELAVIIGKSGRHIPVQRALEHVAGYSVYNEGSVREYQRHNRQFGLGKNFEASGSFGPWMVTPDEFGDPYSQTIITRLNGIERQREGIDHLIFRIEALIQYLSTGYRLRPGDVIVCGTPAAMRFDDENSQPCVGGPGAQNANAQRIYMKPGDTCEVEITGIGTLSNPIAADSPAAYSAG